MLTNQKQKSRAPIKTNLEPNPEIHQKCLLNFFTAAISSNLCLLKKLDG